MSKLYCVEVQKKRKGYTQDEMLKEERKKEIEKKKEKQTEKYMKHKRKEKMCKYDSKII